MNTIPDTKTTTPRDKLFPWLSIISAIYAVIGYFLGKELSPVFGLVATPSGLLIGFLLGRKFAPSNAILKAAVIIAPLILLGLVVSYRNPTTRAVNRKELNGTWIATTSKVKFTLMINNDTCLASMEPGPKNVAYHINLKGDSLTLTAEENNQLSLKISMLSNGVLVFDAGGGLLFSKSK